MGITAYRQTCLHTVSTDNYLLTGYLEDDERKINQPSSIEDTVMAEEVITLPC